MNDTPSPTAEQSKYQRLILSITEEIKKFIIGQDYLIERLLVALVADGHDLVEPTLHANRRFRDTWRLHGIRRQGR